MKTLINVAVLIYNGVELVDMNGPIDVFYHTNEFRRVPYKIYTVAELAAPIASEGSIVTILPQYTIADCPDPDIIVIPGLLDAKGKSSVASPAIVKWIKEMGERKKTILSVCVGAISLAATGLLAGKKATTHYLYIDELHEKYPDIDLVKNVRFVEDDNFLTTGGVTSGIDGALHLIEILDGADVAQHVADIMIYNRNAPLPPYTILPPYYS